MTSVARMPANKGSIVLVTQAAGAPSVMPDKLSHAGDVDCRSDRRSWWRLKKIVPDTRNAPRAFLMYRIKISF